jgi:hypothetical protein
MALRVAANGLAQVPGDGLPLAIEVGRQIDGVCPVRQLLQLGHDFFLARQHLVAGLPTLAGIDAHAPHQLLAGLLLLVRELLLRRHLARDGGLGGALFGVRRGAAGAAGRQIANVSDAGLYDEVRAQILIDSLGFGWRLDDDQ